MSITTSAQAFNSIFHTEYQALLRSLRRRQGFGLLFVSCAPTTAKILVDKLRESLSSISVRLLQLEKPIPEGKFYTEAADFLAKHSGTKILLVQGLEKSILHYEDVKRELGWSNTKIVTYNWEGVPPLLTHLNLQRDRFRDDFPDTCFVFLVRYFTLKYISRRAPDFFDWRSGLFQFPLDQTVLNRESTKLRWQDPDDYFKLSSDERFQRIFAIKELLNEDHLFAHDFAHDAADLVFEQRKLFAGLAFELGNLFAANQNYEEAITSYDKALEYQPDQSESLRNRSIALYYLGRYEEAQSTYGRSLRFSSPLFFIGQPKTYKPCLLFWVQAEWYSDRYSVQAYLVRDRDNYDPSKAEPLKSPAEFLEQEEDGKVESVTLQLILQECLDECLFLLPNDIEVSSIRIEAFLPLSRLGWGVELWPTNAANNEPNIFSSMPESVGGRYTLILRSSERLNKQIYTPEFQRLWEQKWKRLEQMHDRNICEGFICGNHEDGTCKTNEELSRELSQDQTVGLVLTHPPEPFSEANPGPFSLLIGSGVPVALWPRQEVSTTGQRCQDLLNCCPLDLPTKVRELRQEAQQCESSNLSHIGQHLGLIWEDPKLVPPQPKPLRMAG